MNEKSNRDIYMKLEYRGEELPDGSGITGDGRLQSAGTMAQTELMAINLINTLAAGIFKHITEGFPDSFPQDAVQEFAAARLLDIILKGYTDFIDGTGLDFKHISELTDALFAPERQEEERNEKVN